MSGYRVIVWGSGIVSEEVVRRLSGLDFETVWLKPSGRARPEVRRVGSLCGRLRRRVTGKTFVVIASRDLETDLAGLEAVLGTRAALVSVVGGRSRWKSMRKRLMERGLLREKDLDRVRCPAGIEIGSITAAEIGLSIAAQLVQERARQMLGDGVFRRKPAPSLARHPRTATRGIRRTKGSSSR